MAVQQPWRDFVSIMPQIIENMKYEDAVVSPLSFVTDSSVANKVLFFRDAKML